MTKCFQKRREKNCNLSISSFQKKGLKKSLDVFRVAERKTAANLVIYFQLSKCWLDLKIWLNSKTQKFKNSILLKYFRMVGSMAVNNLQILLLFPLTCVAKTGLLIYIFSWREWPGPTKIELTWNWRPILQIYLHFHDKNYSTPVTTVLVQLVNTT